MGACKEIMEGKGHTLFIYLFIYIYLYIFIYIYSLPTVLLAHLTQWLQDLHSS